MTRTIGIGMGIALILVLSLAVAGYAIYDSQTAGAPLSGTTGAGARILLDFDELVIKSDLVVLGEMESSETLTKTAPDTSYPENLRGEDISIQVSQISFTVDEYLKGSGGDTITISMPGEEEPDHGAEDKLAEGTKYVVFLFDPSLRADGDFWGDTYLTQGAQGIWQVSSDDVQRLDPPVVLPLSDLWNAVSKESDQ